LLTCLGISHLIIIVLHLKVTTENNDQLRLVYECRMEKDELHEWRD
jgi:hypothetical protein